MSYHQFCLVCTEINVCMGSLGFADDVILLAHNKQSVQQLVSIAGTFSQEYHVSFNSFKFLHIFFEKILTLNVTLTLWGAV